MQIQVLPTMEEKHKLAQVQAYFRVSEDETNPLHNKIGRVTTSRLKRGAEWMTEAVNTISQCCDVDVIRRAKVWFQVHDPQNTVQELTGEWWLSTVVHSHRPRLACAWKLEPLQRHFSG